MPWSQTSPMDQRTQFIADYLRQVLSVTELCELYGVSRKTGYKLIDRYLRQGPAGLEELERPEVHVPDQTLDRAEAARHGKVLPMSPDTSVTYLPDRSVSPLGEHGI